MQRRLIYFPPPVDPAMVEQLAQAQRLERWNNFLGQPIGWKRLARTRPAVGQLLVLHGNAGCAFQCGHYADVIQAAAPLDIFIVEYPGYAGRPGKPSERALDKSSEEALRAIATNSPIYLLGESLGTGVATYLAGKYPDRVAGAVLLAPYSSLTDVAQVHVRILPVSWILCDRFPSEKYLHGFHGPVAMLVAGGDTVVPAKFGRRLYESYSGPKRLWEFPEGDHGTVMEQPVEIWREIIKFLQDNREPEAASPRHGARESEASRLR